MIANNMPTEIILKIMKVYSKEMEESIILENDVETESLLGLLKCSFVSRSFAKGALQMITGP